MKNSVIEKIVKAIESKKDNQNEKLLSSIIDEINQIEENADFEEISKVLIKHLSIRVDLYHPHHTVILTNTTAELMEGVTKIGTEEYLVD